MIPNVKPSQLYPVAVAVQPQSVAAAGVVTTAYVKVPANSKWLAVATLCGALGGGSEQVDVLQATDTSGTGSKALVTNLRTNAVNNTDTDDDVNLDTLMDINNGFNCVAVKITNTGGTGALVAVRAAFGPAAFLA